MNRRKKATFFYILLLTGLLGLWGCSSPDSASTLSSETEIVEAESSESENRPSSLVYESSIELQYAEQFSIDYYEGGYTMLTLSDGSRFLVIPEGKTDPEGVEADVVVLQRPIKNLYLVASSTMDMFDSLDALDAIRLSGQPEDGWYIEAAKEAMVSGDMLYAGKYNKPDY